MEEVNEEDFIENSPIPVPLKGIEKILKQMQNSICKIYIKKIKKKELDFF